MCRLWSFLLFAVFVSGQHFRLPTHIRPVEYDVTIVPWLDDDDFTFDGAVAIWFKVSESSRNITLHNKDLAVDEDNVLLLDDHFKPVTIERHEYDWEYSDFHVMHLAEELKPTSPGLLHLLLIPFRGVMNEDTVGVWYAQDGPVGRYVIGTQMQPVYTRRVFPCFDEPGFKARFNVFVGHRKETIALSNMPWSSSEPLPSNEQYIIDVFDTSPPMSSYLVAFSVGNLFQIGVEDGLQHLVVREKYLDSYLFPLTRLPKIMDLLESATGYQLPLSKLDHVGLPNFPGGMENWGMIIYGENFILPPDDSDINFPTAVLVHETSHMWTGDVATCEWWDVSWLNEGLTHFFTHWIGSQVEPSTGLFESLGTSLVESTMKAEHQLNSRPMVAETRAPDEIKLQFDIDRIYNRGGIIGRMLYYMLGEEVFLSGMNRYIRDNEFGSVRESHLWEAMQAAVDASSLGDQFPLISDLMSPWTNQAGFPLVTVTRNYENGTAYVKQRRFIFVDNNDHEDETTWTIPLTWTSSNAPDFSDSTPRQFLDKAGDSLIDVNEAKNHDWLLLNFERSGYYRVNYDQKNWELLLEQLLTDPGAIPVVSRAQLTGDVMALCGIHLVDPKLCAAWPLYLTHQESHPVVWQVAAQNFDHLAFLFGNESTYKTSMEAVIRFAEARLLWQAKQSNAQSYADTLYVLNSFRKHLASEGSTPYRTEYYRKWEAYIAAKYSFGR